MTAPHADQMIDGYLARIRDAAGDLRAAARKELLDDMRGHIAEARALEPEETDATILNILDRLGEPGVVVADARERLGIGPASPCRPGLLEIAGLAFLVFFWPVGMVLVWISTAWSVRDKLIGTLVPLAGFIALLVGVAAPGHTGSCGQIIDEAGQVVRNTCSGGGDVPGIVSVVLPILIFGAPLFGVVYLAIRLSWARRAQVASLRRSPEST